MTRVGYARVSSVGQSLEVQLDKLQAAGCDPIFQEKASGTRQDRPQLQECLRYVRTGETLVVTRLDRLARSTFHLCQIAERLRQNHVELLVLDQHIDTSDATGRFLFNMLGAVAHFETEIRAERQMDGIRKAQARGVRFGGRPTLTLAQVAELRAQRAAGVLIKDLMRHYRLSKASVYRYLGGTQPAEAPEMVVGTVHRNGVVAMVD
jgi:DNA invertase Pin-like site-specific DNA recombinase